MADSVKSESETEPEAWWVLVEAILNEWEKRTWFGRLTFSPMALAAMIIFIPILSIVYVNEVLDWLWLQFKRVLPPVYKEEYQDE